MADLAARPESAETSPKTVAPHPGRRLFLTYATLGALATAAGLAMFGVLSGPAMVATGALYCAIGVWFFGVGAYGVAAGSAVQAVNASLNLIGQGRLREAEALLDTVRSSRVRNVQRVALVQRALIALRRGALDDALLAASAATRVPVGFMNQVHAVAQRSNAHGIRAIVRASSGDAEGARADIEEVRRDPSAPPQGLARAALAEALLLEKAGDRGALSALLRGERRLLLDATEPRERAIVRGLQRLVKAPTTSVYRTQAAPATVDAAVEEPALADWVLAVAPGVAPFVRAPTEPARAPAPPRGPAELVPDEASRSAILADRTRAARAATRAAAPKQYAWAAVLVAAVVGLSAAFHRFATLADVPPEHYDEAFQPGQRAITVLAVMVSCLLSLAVVRVAARVRRARSETRDLTRIATQMLRGEHDSAARDLEPLTRSTNAYVGAQAELLRAQLADRRGDFAAALARCDAALGRLSRYATRVLATDLLLPEIGATRASALAALGRAGEATAEIAALPPAFPYLARARFRTELISLARRGDFAAAAETAARAPADLPIGPRDELLRDLVRATAQPETAGGGEIERLREELRSDPEERAWIEHVAPGLLGAFERATTHDEDARAEAEAAAEAEAIAAAEAEALAGPHAAPTTKLVSME